MGIINDVNIVLSLDNAIHYDAKFTLPLDIDETIYPLYLFPNGDKHQTECYDYIVSSRIDTSLLVYLDAFQISWANSEIVRYHRLSEFILMGLTQKDELVSVTFMHDIRKYIEMDNDKFGDSLNIDIYPYSENQELDEETTLSRYQQIIHPKIPAYLCEIFLLGLAEIRIFDKIGNKFEQFFNINFRGEKFTLHQDFDLWIISDFDGKVSQSNFQALVEYLETNNNRKLKNFYLTLKDRLLFWY